jgi:DNA-binding transcriptional MerR regulator
MRISELSRKSGLPVGTLKYYLRTGLLQSGQSISATQAEYDDDHLDRLRLIRALQEVGHLSHAEIQRVLEAMSLPADDEGLALQTVHDTTASRVDGEELDLAPAHEVISDLGWRVNEDSPHLVTLARALAALDGIGQPPSDERLRLYAEAANGLSRDDVRRVMQAGPDERVLAATSTSVIWEALLASLRRLAAEHHMTVRRGAGGVPGPRRELPEVSGMSCTAP